jgi:hypothetical protein
LADSSLISFEAYNQPCFFIGRKMGITALVEITDATSTTDREVATFIEER